MTAWRSRHIAATALLAHTSLALASPVLDDNASDFAAGTVMDPNIQPLLPFRGDCPHVVVVDNLHICPRGYGHVSDSCGCVSDRGCGAYSYSRTLCRVQGYPEGDIVQWTSEFSDMI